MVSAGKALLLFCYILSLFVTEAYSQKISLPRFEDYPVSQVFKGKPAPVDLGSHPRARLFRTRLLEGAKQGPNFAGHYTVVMWGCGSDCMEVAIVNTKTGRVYFAPFTVTPGMEADYRINSRLFVRNPPERNARPIDEEMLDVYKPSWHVWEGNRFVKVPVKIKYKKPHEEVGLDTRSMPPNALKKREQELLSSAIHRIEPTYPPLAKAARVSGQVIVRVIIDEDGNVTDAQVASGHPLLRLAVLDAACGWKFKPAELNGGRVPVVGNVTFNFVLPEAQRRTL